MIVALGHSEELDSADAIAAVLQQCTDSLNRKRPQAGLLYAGIDHDFQVLLDRIEDHFPGIQLIGCTTHGEISSAGFAEDSVVLMLFHSERVQFRARVGEGVRADPEGAARRAVEAALDGLTAPVRLGITLPEGLGVDADTVLPTLCVTLGPDVPVCGGLAGDQLRFEQTYQFCNGVVYTDAVPVLCFAGSLDISTGAVPEVALVFSCAGRHALLGTRVRLESGQLSEHVGTEIPTIGFYTYGEICPLPAAPEPVTHGVTFVTVLIGEHA